MYYLSSCFSSAVLPTFDETGIPVCPDNPVVQPGPIDVPDGIFPVATIVIPEQRNSYTIEIY